jgi:hypothetical protein
MEDGTMSITHLHDVALPLNRKERFYTGTVFPMIVFADNFRWLPEFLKLLPGCPAVEVDGCPDTANIQVFTEYSLAESTVGRARTRLPDPPRSKETPDIVMLVDGPERLLVAIEAKMYDTPNRADLNEQMRAQQVHLQYLVERLGVRHCHHVALLPERLADEVGPLSFPVVTWEQVCRVFLPLRGPHEHFLGVLRLALAEYDSLVSRGSGSYGANAQRHMTGQEILDSFGKDPGVQTMGRRRGLHGAELTRDVEQDAWRTHVYEVSASPVPVNLNWFLVDDFQAKVRAHAVKERA